jgi:hypothetical protein
VSEIIRHGVWCRADSATVEVRLRVAEAVLLQQQEAVMAHQAPEHNPFMLMINPEVVLAAMAKSERLGQLNRHLCRPLDRLVTPGADANAADPDEPHDGLTPSDPR